MSILNSKFDVVRGWPQPGATIDESYKPAGSYVPAEGDIVAITVASGEPRIELATATRLDNLATTSVADFRDALVAAISDLPHLWLVVSGMQPTTDFDGVFVGKAVCILGTYMVRTENFESGDTYTIGGPVTVESGVIRSNPFSGQTHQKYGEVIEQDTTAGTLIVAVNSAGM